MPDHFDPNAHLNEALKSAYQHAMAAAQRGKHQDALQGYKECIRIAARDRQVLPLYLLANILTNMGYCLVDLGKRQQAMSYYRQVEALLLKDTAKIQEICQHFSLTVAAFENQDLRHELGKLYDSMGLFYDTQDEWQEAIRCYQRALRIFHDLKDLQSCTLTYYYIAISYQRRQDWPNLQRAGEHLLKYALASKDAGYELQARRFLAQSAANLERFDDMVNQLESAVSLGRKLGDPKVAIDEKLLESARQQTRNGRASAPGQIVPPESYRRFQPHQLVDEVSIQKLSEGGYPKPTFILHTSHFDEAAELLRTFQLHLLPVSLEQLRKLPLPPGTVIPSGGYTKIELSLDDLNPSILLHEVVIPEKLHRPLWDANQESRALTFILEGQRRSEPIPGTFEAYQLDWSGALGICTYVRTTWKTIKVESVRSLCHGLEAQIDANGILTGIYTEMGILHRLIEEYDQAIEYYRREIQFNRKKDGLPGIGAARALNNLGVIYKRQGKFDAARDAFAVAQSLNPNFFEALLSMSGVVTDESAALALLARAFRIRSDTPLWNTVIEQASAGLNLPPSQVLNAIQDLSRRIDLASKPEFDHQALKRLGL